MTGFLVGPVVALIDRAGLGPAIPGVPNKAVVEIDG
jgi:hypothetical protein